MDRSVSIISRNINGCNKNGLFSRRSVSKPEETRPLASMN